MGSTLEHGIYLPSEGEKNCYQGLAGNWNKVDGALGDVAELKQSIESKFTKEIVTELPTEDINPFCIYMILKTDPETDNIYDEWVYINNSWEYLGNTKVDMTQYYTKQEVNELPAVASGVTSTKVGNYDTHLADSNIHVTSADKTKWNTVALIKQLRLVNAQVGSATTIAFANIDDTNGIKVGDKCMDLDGIMFEITAVDTTNQTVTVGSALIDLALDANVMHLSGNESASGNKTFSDDVSVKMLTATGKYISDEGSTNRRTVLKLLAGTRDTDGYSCSYVTRVRSNKAQGALISSDVQTLGFDFVENQVRTLNTFIIRATNWLDNVPQKIELTSNISNYTYGSITNKAKINDLNPGSLSLPDLDNGLDISGYITAGNSHNEYTPPVDGWISVIIKKTTTSGALAIFLYQGDVGNSYFGNTSLPNESEFCGMASIPVKAGAVVNIDLKGSNTYVYSAKFYPCQGNV